MKSKWVKLNNNSSHIESKSINAQVSDLLYKTLISRSDEINIQNSRFMDGLKNWYKIQLDKYKHNLLESGNWWNPESDKSQFNNKLINSLESILITISGKNLKSPDWIRKKLDIDGSASNFLIKKYFNPIIHSSKSQDKLQEINISLREKKDFDNTKIIIDKLNYSVSNYTYIVYCLLEIIWLVPNEEKKQLKNFVDFINIVDYIPYEEAEQLYLDSYKTLLWIVGFLNANSVFNYFKFNNNWLKCFDERLLKNETTDSYWRNTTFGELSEKRKKLIEISLKKYEIAQNNWLVVNWNKNKYLIDIWINIPNWPELVAYKKIWLFKIFPSWDIYINNPYWLDEYFYQLWNVVKWKLYFLKSGDQDYKTNAILLLNRMNFDDITKNLIIKYIKKTTKQEIPIEIIDEEKIISIIEQLKYENISIIEKIKEINQDTIFEDLDQSCTCKWVVTHIFKYWVIINIWWLRWLLHKTNISVTRIKDHFKVWEIIEVWISKITIQEWEKKISFY